VATFDKLASRYAERYFHLRQYDRHYQALVEAVSHEGPAWVLDLACGPGNVAAYLREARPDWTLLCTDLAPAMLKEAAARVPGIHTRLLDACQVGTLPQRFDAAAFCFGLSYLDDAGARQCLQGLHQVLRPGAPLLLMTLTGDPAQSGPQTASTGDVVHMACRRAGTVVDLVAGHGFEILRSEVIDSPPEASQVTQDVVVLARRRP
jgi:ubiquinone/menaquinone biosynthesis C-methylase UbiE